MPGLTIFDPCDVVDNEQALPQLAPCESPTYTRLLRGAVPRILDDYDYTFGLGKAKVVRPREDVVFVSSGLMTMRGLLAAEELARRGVEVCVVSNNQAVRRGHGRRPDRHRPDGVHPRELHFIGRLFESVASALAKRGIGRKVRPIGLPDEFCEAGALPTLHDR